MAKRTAPEWIVERLQKGHDREQFDSGMPQLDEFLKKRATQFAKRNLGRTYVARKSESQVVLGFYTLATGAVTFDQIPDEAGRGLPAHIPIPVLHLGQLAVDRRAQGAGLGSFLLMDALHRGLQHADEIGMQAVEVVAVNEEAARFYRKYGFTELLDDRRHMYLPMKTVARLFR